MRAAVDILPKCDGYLTLNVSAATLSSPSFVATLEGLPLERVVLEITEHEVIEDYDDLAATLTPLRRRGVRVAVDDAGAGFASLRHILSLAPDLIKLDISLVQGIATDTGRQALAYALRTFADNTHASIVAEGIETADELDCLRGLGIGFGQGFHLARPAPMTVVLAGD